MNIIEALENKRIFGCLVAFRDLTSWSRWLTFMKALYGIEMSATEQRIFCEHTGRMHYDPPPGGYAEAAAIVGRQSGKTRIAATIAAFEAMQPQPSDGGELYAILVAQDQRAALRAVFSYARGPFEQVRLLAQMVTSPLRESVTLKSGCTLAAYPCRPASIRGLRARVVVLDELAFFRNSENFPVDLEMLRAARPCLATTGGKLVILSSPHAQTGALYELHRKHYGRDDSTTLVWVGSAPAMNPLLPKDYLKRMRQDDPEAYRSEVLGEFRAGLTTFLDPDAIQACVAAGVRERPPQPQVIYHAFVDVSGGRNDRFCVAVAHREPPDRAVLDAIRYWTPSPKRPLNPKAVIAEAAEFLRTYRLSSVVGDKYGAEFTTAEFRTNGLTYVNSPLDRSQIYLNLLPRINAGTAVLLDEPELLRELRGLERRSGGTHDRIDHGIGSHDDIANACAGALSAIQTPTTSLSDGAIVGVPIFNTTRLGGDPTMALDHFVVNDDTIF